MDMTVDDISQRLDQTFGAAAADDWAGFRAMFAEDGIVRQNLGEAMTMDQAMEALPALTADGTTLAYENVRRCIGDRCATEIHDAVFTKPDGREIRLDICVVVHFGDDGLITSAEEYLDSAQAAALFT